MGSRGSMPNKPLTTVGGVSCPDLSLILTVLCYQIRFASNIWSDLVLDILCSDLVPKMLHPDFLFVLGLFNMLGRCLCFMRVVGQATVMHATKHSFPPSS